MTGLSDRRVDEIRDERSSGGDFFVYLKPGFAISQPPQHCFGARNEAEIKKTLKVVYPCNCDDCAALAKAKGAA